MKTSTSLAVLVLADLLAMSPLSAAPAASADEQATAPAAAPAAPATTGAESRAAEAAQAELDAGGEVADAQGLEEIVVTATKRATDLQKTPIAITVLNGDTLKQQHVLSLFNLSDGSVPSLRVAPFEARQSALTVGIRGIVPLDANQPAREQGVGIYIDGIYLGRQHGINTALFDVERVEVLKGPQGTLFGRNTEGGALSIVNKAPSGEFGGRVTAGYGNYNSYNAELHMDLPEFHNFSVKFDGVLQHQDATTTNPLDGQYGWNYQDRKGARVAVRWQPVEELTNDFVYDVATAATTPFYSQLLNYNPNNCPSGGTATNPIPVSAAPNCVLPGTAITGFQGTIKPLLPGVQIVPDKIQTVADIGVPQQPSVDNTWGVTNIFKYHFGPEIELRSLTGWRGVDSTQWDNSGGAHRPPVVAPGCVGTACNFSRYSLADLNQTQFSQELQAVGTIGSVDYVGGLYYYIENVSDDAATPNSMAIIGYKTAGQTSGYSYTPIDPCTGSGGFGSQRGCRSIDRASKVRSQSFAVYGQGTWHATDALSLILGGRYTRDHKQGELLYSRNIFYPDNPAIANANGYAPLDETWNRFNPMVTLGYQATDDVFMYAKYATGYRSGGASSRTANYQQFGPEDVKSYEIGLKSQFFDNRARLNLAAYIMDRKNSQVDISSVQFTATGNFNNLVTINAPGTTKIRGVELDLTVAPMDNLTFNVQYAYTYTNIPPVLITSTSPAGTTAVYQQFYIPYTPPNAVSASADYAIPIVNDTALRLHLDLAYSQATQAFDQFEQLNDASFFVNGRLSMTEIQLSDAGQTLTLAFWCRNIFNGQYIFRNDPSNSYPAAPTTNVFIGNVNNVLGNYGNFNAPRTFGIEGTVHF